jgi:hypothetical protein
MTQGFLPTYIQQSLQDLGYELRSDLGDRVISQSDQNHFIYIQVRDGRRTYIPVTITQPVNVSESLFESDTVIEQPSHIELVSIPEQSSSQDTETITPTQVNKKETTVIWDQNVQDLLDRISTTREKIHRIIHQ